MWVVLQSLYGAVAGIPDQCCAKDLEQQAKARERGDTRQTGRTNGLWENWRLLAPYTRIREGKAI